MVELTPNLQPGTTIYTDSLYGPLDFHLLLERGLKGVVKC